MSKNIDLLKKLQASLIVFTQKLYNIHWNMRNPQFFSLHQATEDLFKEVTIFYDDVAEKILMHNELCVGTLKESLDLSIIKEIKEKHFNEVETCEIIVRDLKSLIDLIDSVEGTNTIQPMLDEFYLSFDKWIWKFNSCIKK